MVDPINKPRHYQFGQFEAWDIIELAIEGIQDPVTAYHSASALKYLLRAARKGGGTDIAKASAHLKRETARHAVRLPPSPDYDPASVAFGHVSEVPFEIAAPANIDVSRWFRGTHPRVPNPGTTIPKTAAELADADGCMEYGNPVTPGCAPWRLP